MKRRVKGLLPDAEPIPPTPPPFNPNTRYLTAAQLAERYGVTRVSIYDWIKRGILPPGEIVGVRRRRWRSDLIEAHDWLRRSAMR